MAGLTETLWYVGFFFKYFSWWVVPIFMLIVGKIKWGKWPLEVEILERRGDNIISLNDRAGRMYGKESGLTNYKLQKMGDTIDVVPFDCVLHYTFKPTTFLEWLQNKLRPTVGKIHLLKYGSKQYKPIKVTSSEKGLMAQDENGNFIAVKEMVDEKGNLVYKQNLQPFDIRDHLGVMDFQIIDWDDINTTLAEIENSRLRRIAKYDRFMKYLVPVAVIAVVGVLGIVFLYLTYSVSMETCAVAGQQTPVDQPMQAPLGGEDSTVTNLVPVIG